MRGLLLSLGKRPANISNGTRVARIKTTGFIVLAVTLMLVGATILPVAAGDAKRRPLDDAFVDTFFLEDVEPIRAQMPTNWGDPETNLLAGIRVDNLDAVAAGAPYETFDAMLLAFYENQEAFNKDPNRNRIKMHGTVEEFIEEDGTVVVKANILYKNLPLTVYTLDSFETAIENLNPAQTVKVLVDGSMNAYFSIEMEIPEPGAPLHYWDAVLSGGIRRQTFIGYGNGRLVDGNDDLGAQVFVFQVERNGEFLWEIVRIKQNRHGERDENEDVEALGRRLLNLDIPDGARGKRRNK